jgi:hypothetical protein
LVVRPFIQVGPVVSILSDNGPTHSISNSCGGTVSWEMKFTSGNTGAGDFVRTGSTYYSTATGTVDEDWATNVQLHLRPADANDGVSSKPLLRASAQLSGQRREMP